MKKQWTKERIDKEIRKFDKAAEPESEVWQAYRVLFTALAVDPPYKVTIPVFWGSDNAGMVNMIKRAYANGVFYRDGKLSAEIYEDGVGLAMGGAVLLGWVNRVKKKAA